MNHWSIAYPKVHSLDMASREHLQEEGPAAFQKAVIVPSLSDGTILNRLGKEELHTCKCDLQVDLRLLWLSFW